MTHVEIAISRHRPTCTCIKRPRPVKESRMPPPKSRQLGAVGHSRIPCPVSKHLKQTPTFRACA
ncbi:Hypothetical protein FKW44_006281 [Caligus rogercresseyi]|uniref:Uncharacterized protein n=1 Tax=Caligus rogercresseyi TaxID=217165 RepID=A0A7T8KD52_CALRO|nr:Hypothetical protein FKW44_006281 [Caligus rogercresseyi]